jgi:serine/threonine protein phosphatase PrpC
MAINLTVCGATNIGRVRKGNEDAFVIADLSGASLATNGPITRFEIGERGVLLAVSDGMGGHNAGEVASALVVESLGRAMAHDDATHPGDALVEKAVKSANREVWEASHLPGRENMGATLTAMFLEGGTAHIAEVGDSRAYLLRNGHLVQVTRDQSYVQALVDAGALEPHEAATSPFRNIILQAMGQQPNVQVALGRLSLRQRDCFLLCSDGLTNKVTPEEMVEIMLSAPRMDVACTRLIARANENGGEDNITVVMGGVSGDLPACLGEENIADTLEHLQEYVAPPLQAPSASAAGRG